MDAEKFIERINEAEKVLKYTFRLELEDDGADDLGKSLMRGLRVRRIRCLSHLLLTDGAVTLF